MKYHVSFDIDLRRNPYKGKYIALEGADGAGKTTQVKKLAKYFEDQGKEVILVREPRKKGLVGDIVQKVLTGKIAVPPQALQYLFSTDRVMHHAEVIEPALKAGKVVITDRCFWSAVVYGILDKTSDGYKYSEADQLLIGQSILSMYHQFIVPDHTLYLRISPKESMQRLGTKEDSIEIYEDEDKIKKIIKGYDWIIERFPQEFKTINGEQDPAKVTAEIISEIYNS